MTKKELLNRLKRLATEEETAGKTKRELEEVAQRYGISIDYEPEKTDDDEPEKPADDDGEPEKPADDDAETEKPAHDEPEKPADDEPEKPADDDAELQDRMRQAREAQHLREQQEEEKKKTQGGQLFSIEKKKRGRRESKATSFRVEGYILLLATDTLFPFAFSFLNNMISNRIKINSSELALSDEQFKKLEPLADQAADYLSINLNPVVGFGLTAGMFYYGNLMAVRDTKKSNE